MPRNLAALARSAARVGATVVVGAVVVGAGSVAAAAVLSMSGASRLARWWARAPKSPALPVATRISEPLGPEVRAGQKACCPSCETEWVAEVDDEDCWSCDRTGFGGALDEYCKHLVRGGRTHPAACRVCAVAHDRAPASS